MKFELTALQDRLKKLLLSNQRLTPVESIWAFVLVVFVIVNILVVVWSFILFLRVNSDDIFAVEIQQGEAVETLNRTQLKELTETLKERRATFESKAR